ncbi:hypothetical protein BGZ81_007318 [Podila clonocystis]|nr:hypothetical protein BGZ81_007318 [Podila clonocystis]
MADCSSSISRTGQATLHALANSLVSESKIGRRGNFAQRARLFPRYRTAPSVMLNMFKSNRVCREDQYNGYDSVEDTKHAEFRSHPQQIGQLSARLHSARGHINTLEEVWTQSSASPAAEASFPPPAQCQGGTADHSQYQDQILDNAFSRRLAVSDPIIADIFHRYCPANWDPAEGDEDGLRYTEGFPNNITQVQHKVPKSTDKQHVKPDCAQNVAHWPAMTVGIQAAQQRDVHSMEIQKTWISV